MAEPEAPRFAKAPPEGPRSEEHRHLSRLSTALTRYGVWGRIIDNGVPYLRAGNPGSDYAVEDVACERRSHDYAFVASFGVCLGNSDSTDLTARKVAWLVGATGK